MDTSLLSPILLIALPIVAFLYASVGHGGASGYLALMAIFAFPSVMMKPSALLLNIFVAGISFYYYWKKGHFNFKLFYPFALTSIPASFIGGYMNVDPKLYRQILGILLLFAILRILGFFGRQDANQLKEVKLISALILGAVIGFFSGLIGIGGGIILSPVILLLAWGGMKETAAVSALFIWVNSVSGMIGLISAGESIPSTAYIMVLCALVGGGLGAYYGSRNTTDGRVLKYILAIVLFIASLKLIFML